MMFAMSSLAPSELIRYFDSADRTSTSFVLAGRRVRFPDKAGYRCSKSQHAQSNDEQRGDQDSYASSRDICEQ